MLVKYKLIGFPDSAVEQRYGKYLGAVVTHTTSKPSGTIVVKLPDGKPLCVKPDNLEAL